MKNKKVKRIFTASLIALVTVSACAKHHPAEAYEALAALRKVQAATQVGVNYQQYGQLLIEAKDKTNASSRVLPDGPIKTEIQATMDAYADATQVWQAKSISISYEPGRTLASKYSLKHDQYGNIADNDDATRTIWLNADLHLSKLADLLPK